MVKAFGSRLEQTLKNLSIPQDIAQDFRSKEIELAGLELPPGLDPSVTAAIRRAISDAFRSGFHLVLLSCGGLSATSALVAWKLIASGTEIRRDQL